MFSGVAIAARDGEIEHLIDEARVVEAEREVAKLRPPRPR